MFSQNVSTGLNITTKAKYNNNMKCNGYNVTNILLNKIILII